VEFLSSQLFHSLRAESSGEEQGSEPVQNQLIEQPAGRQFIAEAIIKFGNYLDEHDHNDSKNELVKQFLAEISKIFLTRTTTFNSIFIDMSTVINGDENNLVIQGDDAQNAFLTAITALECH